MRTFLRILLWTFGTLSVVCIVLYFTLLEPWTVPADDPQLAVSIVPTLGAGDYVVLSRQATNDPGALVRCADPDAPGRFVIGRVLAAVGTVIDINGGVIRLDNHSPPSPVACTIPHYTVRNPATGEDMELDCSNEELGGSTHEMLHGKTVEKDTHVTQEPGTVFLVSDNRVLHLDSRDFGQVQTKTCQRIVMRLWSADGQKRFNLIW